MLYGQKIHLPFEGGLRETQVWERAAGALLTFLRRVKIHSNV